MFSQFKIHLTGSDTPLTYGTDAYAFVFSRICQMEDKITVLDWGRETTIGLSYTYQEVRKNEGSTNRDSTNTYYPIQSPEV